MEVSAPILIGTATLGEVTIGLAEDTIRWQIKKTILLIGVFTVIVASALGTVFFAAMKKIILEPITWLAHATTRIAKGDLNALAKIKATGELQMLVDSFNKMIADLNKTTISKDYVDNIVRSMTETLIVVSPEGRIKMVNAAGCALLGYKEDELSGQPFEMILGLEFIREDASELNKLLK